MLTRKIDGKTVEISDVEEKELREEWSRQAAAAETERADRKARKDAMAVNAAKLEKATGLTVDEIKDILRLA